MTDEEMADKYVKDTGNNDCTIEAYLAGLKAGEEKGSGLMSEDDFETIGNCLTGIIAIAERQNNEYTDVIKMLALQADRILYEVKEKEDKNA